MDVAIYYEGGSGGFYTLWHILLGSDLRCEWNWELHFSRLVNSTTYKATNDLDLLYNIQWDMKEQSTWKSTDIWPKNSKTYFSNLTNKLYYYCNPNDRDFFRHKDCLKIYLYTDIGTINTLAKAKKANWYKPNRPAITSPLEYRVYNNTNIYYKSYVSLQYADKVIKLQDIVNTNGSAILELIGETATNKNLEHNKKWLSLHNEEQIKLLTI